MHMPDRVCQRMNVEYLIPFSEHHCCLFFPLFAHSLMRFKQCCFFKLRYSPAIYFFHQRHCDFQSAIPSECGSHVLHYSSFFHGLLFSGLNFIFSFIQFQLFDSSELLLNFTFSLAYLRNSQYNSHKS